MYKSAIAIVLCLMMTAPLALAAEEARVVSRDFSLGVTGITFLRYGGVEVGGSAFEVLPGETEVSVELSGAYAAHVYFFPTYEGMTRQAIESQHFCGSADVAIPEGAVEMMVYIGDQVAGFGGAQPENLGACGPEVALTGTITATFR